MLKSCPICKALVTPGLDGGCTECGVSLDDVPEAVDVDTMVASMDAVCASCGGLLMGATDTCPLCSAPIEAPAPPAVEAAPTASEPFVENTFIPAPPTPEAGDTFVPPIESFIAPQDATAPAVASASAPMQPPEMGVEQLMPPETSVVPRVDGTAESVAAQSPFAEDEAIAAIDPSMSYLLPDESPAEPALDPGPPVQRPPAPPSPALAAALWDAVPEPSPSANPAAAAAAATPGPALDERVPGSPPTAPVANAPAEPAAATPPALAMTSAPAPASNGGKPAAAPPWQSPPAIPAPAPKDSLELDAPKKPIMMPRKPIGGISTGTVRSAKRRARPRILASFLLLIGLAAAAAVGAAQLGWIQVPAVEAQDLGEQDALTATSN